MKYPLLVIDNVLEQSIQIKSNRYIFFFPKKKSNTFKPHCIGVRSANGIQRVNNSQRRIANDQISDAFVNIPFSNTKNKINNQDIFSFFFFYKLNLPSGAIHAG
jgi:hypothetical protein